MLKAIAIATLLVAGVGSSQAHGLIPADPHQRPYAEGELERIIAASPTVEDLVRAMLVGDDPERIEVLVEIIAGPDEHAPIVVAQR